MKKKFTMLLASLFLYMGAWAQEVGKVYSIVNASYSTAIYENSSKEAIVTTVASDINSTDAYSQLWLVENGSTEGKLKLRNASTGNYLVHNTTIDVTWSTNSSGSEFFIADADGEYKYITWETVEDATSGTLWGFAHATGDGRLVRWKVYEQNTWNTASEWTFNESTVTKEDLEATWETLTTAAQNELREELTSAEALMSVAGFAVTKGEPVALTVGDGGNLTTNYPAIDNDVLGHCIDGDETTLFHSNWNASTTGGHYLQVDLGEGIALDAFVLDYTTRASGNNGAPYSITVSGSNDGNNFTPIKELSKDNIVNPLPAVNAKSYTTTIVADEAYRYLRFTVNSSPIANGSFGLAEFALTKATWTKPTGDYENRAALLNSLYNAVELAKELTTSTNKDELNDTKEFVAFVRNGVTVKEYPFTITTDVAAPVCYLIKSARTDQWGASSYWRFISSGDDANCFTIEKYAENNAAKDINAYWYFVENEEVGYLEMVPFVSPVAMGYTTVGDGAKKLTNDHSASGFVSTIYSFINEANSTWDGYPYALQPVGYTTYVSNHGGYGYMMGFYSTLNDGGTRFTLFEANTPSAKLVDLNEAIATAQEYEAGEAVGEYTTASIDNLASVIENALAVYNDVTSTDDECQVQITALQTAIDGLTINLPETGKFYTIQSNHSDYAAEKYMYARNTDNSVRWGDIDVTNATEQAAVWTFGANGENFTMQSVATGSYINSVEQSTTVVLDNNTSSTVSIKSLGNGVVNITAAYDLHARIWEDWYDVVGWNSNETDGASAWRIAEVDIFSHTLTIDEYLYMTLQLGYNVTIPEGIEAYAVTGVDTETNELQMEQITGVIPANTAVIVKSTEEIATGETKDYVFTYTAEAGTKPAVNYMVGSLYDTYLQPTGTPYVMTLNSNNEIVMGKAKLNLNEAGETGETHIRNRANKAYLDLPGASEVRMFSFGRGEGTTNIDSTVNGQQSTVIYDLTGRRVEKMEKGIYIVNGQKIIK